MRVESIAIVRLIVVFLSIYSVESIRADNLLWTMVSALSPRAIALFVRYNCLPFEPFWHKYRYAINVYHNNAVTLLQVFFRYKVVSHYTLVQNVNGDMSQCSLVFASFVLSVRTTTTSYRQSWSQRRRFDPFWTFLCACMTAVGIWVKFPRRQQPVTRRFVSSCTTVIHVFVRAVGV